MGIASRGIRTARAGLFATLCVTLSAGAHVLLSGAPLPLLPLAALSAGVFLLAFALADRERGFGRIAALLIPLELVADTVFTTGQQACYGQAGGPVTGPLRSVGVDLLCGGGPVGAALTGLAAHGRQTPGAAPLARLGPLGADPALTPWLLLAAHVGVGLVAAAWLRRGEAALARLLRAASTVAFRPLWLALTAVAAGRPARALPVRGRRPLPAAGPLALPLLVRCAPRRGPPVPLLAA